MPWNGFAQGRGFHMFFGLEATVRTAVDRSSSRSGRVGLSGIPAPTRDIPHRRGNVRPPVPRAVTHDRRLRNNLIHFGAFIGGIAVSF
jgi:hypothetical protein